MRNNIKTVDILDLDSSRFMTIWNRGRLRDEKVILLLSIPKDGGSRYTQEEIVRHAILLGFSGEQYIKARPGLGVHLDNGVHIPKLHCKLSVEQAGEIVRWWNKATERRGRDIPTKQITESAIYDIANEYGCNERQVVRLLSQVRKYGLKVRHFKTGRRDESRAFNYRRTVVYIKKHGGLSYLQEIIDFHKDKRIVTSRRLSNAKKLPMDYAMIIHWELIRLGYLVM